MRRSTCDRPVCAAACAPDTEEIGMNGFSFKKLVGAALGLPVALPAVATSAAVVAPAVAVTTAASPLLMSSVAAHAVGMNTPDEIKNLGEKFNIGQHTDDWERWAKGSVDVATLGASRNKSVRDAVKDLGEKWNVGNNSVDTLKSIANVASIVGAISGIGTLASALIGSSTLSQGALTVAREYARQSVKSKIIGKAGEELADPYVDHLIRKARRDQQALAAEEAALVEQYKQQRPGVYSLMMMAIENPNALDTEQMQVIVNYQRDLERERAIASNMALPPDEDWVNYYTRFLAEYGVAWNPPINPGVDLIEGGGLPPPAIPSLKDMLERMVGRETDTEQRDRLERGYVVDVAKQPRIPQSLAMTPQLKAALDSLYPPTKTA